MTKREKSLLSILRRCLYRTPIWVLKELHKDYENDILSPFPALNDNVGKYIETILKKEPK